MEMAYHIVAQKSGQQKKSWFQTQRLFDTYGKSILLKYKTDPSIELIEVYKGNTLIEKIDRRVLKDGSFKYKIIGVSFGNNKIYDYLLINNTGHKITQGQQFYMIYDDNKQITTEHLYYADDLPLHITKKLTLTSDHEAIAQNIIRRS